MAQAKKPVTKAVTKTKKAEPKKSAPKKKVTIEKKPKLNGKIVASGTVGIFNTTPYEAEHIWVNDISEDVKVGDTIDFGKDSSEISLKKAYLSISWNFFKLFVKELFGLNKF